MSDLKQIQVRQETLLHELHDVLSVEVRRTIEEEGSIEAFSDGVARVRGLLDAGIGDAVTFRRAKNNVGEGFVFDLDEKFVNCLVIRGDIIPGDRAEVNPSEKGLKIPVGDELLSGSEPFVISPSGSNFWDGSELKTKERQSIEKEAPGILKRDLITSQDQIYTGIELIDTQFPIHHGQRMLVLGDKESGKTTLMLEILNKIGTDRKESETLFVYVAVAKEAGQIRHIQKELNKISPNKSRAVLVATRSSDAASLHYAAPFAGATIAEYWAERGKRVVIVYDDLTQHAAAYRQIALLLQHSPGREAYPGDIFYLHSRLLERAAKLIPPQGSITAIPILETIEGDYVGYLPTNAISISDGQIILSSEIKYADPNSKGIDAFHSISRIR